MTGPTQTSSTSAPVVARPLTVAVIGAGPSGIYAAEALSQQSEVPVRVAVLDRLPVPFGLVRYGVAPDHPSIRSIRHTLERTLEKSGVRFYGDVQIGRDLTVAELRSCVDAVVYAYGAGSDKRLGIPGEDLPGSISAPEFVAWYCGHPDVHPDVDRTDHGDADHPATGAPFPLPADDHPPVADLVAAARDAVVVGAGNVALDVARVMVRADRELAETDMADEVLDALRERRITDVHLLARRGPASTAFTTKELRELGALADVDLVVDPADLELDEAARLLVAQDKVAARNLAVFTEWAARPRTDAAHRVHLHFWTSPREILGDDRVAGVVVGRTGVDRHGASRAEGPSSILAAQLVVRAIGYRGLPMPGVPFDESTGRVPHDSGRVIRDGGFSADEYVTGWIKRGPTGVIGTNKSDAVETVAALLDDVRAGTLVPAGHHDTLDTLLAGRGLHPLDLPAWHRIDLAEIELGASHGRQRTTLAHRSELLAAAEDHTG